MKKTAKCAACLFPTVVLVLALGCKPKPVKVESPSAAPQAISRNNFIGTWEGKDSKGAIYTIKFTNNLQWESHIEEGGVARPHYKGTYEPEGSRVRMKVTEEADLKTFGWRPERGNMPTNIIGTFSGSTLTVGSVLTDAELKRH
ncbi:MAG: hypothetical protein LBC63_10100 [Holophagales bacterium]|jgi:hypothetical protein|nr:hypothetical protein [Holophagales bacterium]